MIKHLTQHGNSSALVIEKAILELLGISQKTALEVSTDGRNLVISPVDSDKRGSKIKKALAKVNKNHSKTLRGLAK
jgi:antitoxin component of MazEF toxin-antitoxin module